MLNDKLRTSDKDGYDFNTLKDIAEERGIKMNKFYEDIDVILKGKEIALR